MERILVYNPMYDKVPTGAAVVGSAIRFEVQIEKSYALSLKGVHLIVDQDGDGINIKIPMKETTSTTQYARYTYTHIFDKKGVFFYYFEIEEQNKSYYLEQGEYLNAVSCDKVTNMFLQLVTEEQPEAESFYGGIMYHIFVDRFCSKDADENAYKGKVLRKDWGGEINSYIGQKEVLNNEFYGGNFKGIISKLDYLQELGVTTLYLSPICKANSNHKYDIGDYMTIAEEFGGEEDFKLLVEKAKEHGMGIIIDAVFNHTGSDSLYFNKNGNYDSIGAYQSTSSPYYDWYRFSNFPDTYDCWWGVKIMPQIYKESESFQNFICEKVLPKYMELGVQGFRFDVIDELSASFVDRIADTVRGKNPETVLIGEVWEDASIKTAYDEQKRYFEDAKLNSVMNYPVKDAIINYCLNGDENALAYNLRIIKDHYPKQVQNCLMNIIGTHDTMRILSVLSTGRNSRDSSYGKHDTPITKEQLKVGINRLKIASLLQFTVMGVPCIYYGDEAGLTGDGDPFNRKCFPWDNINNEILDWYKNLGRIRKNNVFEYGDLNVLYNANGAIVYERLTVKDRVLVLINNGEFPFEGTIDNLMKDMLTGEFVKGDVVIAPHGYLILEKVE